jgi:hypothetical protein
MSTKEWMDGIAEAGEQSRDQKQEIRADRIRWLLTYFADHPDKISDLGGKDILVLWTPEGPVLNSNFAAKILGSEPALYALWEEINRRVHFDGCLWEYLTD